MEDELVYQVGLVLQELKQETTSDAGAQYRSGPGLSFYDSGERTTEVSHCF